MKKLSLEEVISRMKELEPNYNFDYFEYNGKDIKSKIICDKGHEYNGRWNDFRNGKRCPICKGGAKYEPEKALNILNGLQTGYDFSNFEYINAHNKSIVICPNGHEYLTSYTYFYNKNRRCPYCSNIRSKPETEIIDFVKTFYNGTIEQSNRNIIKNHMTNRYLELDIYLPELNKAIEFNGNYFHTDEKVKQRGWSSADEKHIMKTIYCKAKGIDLLHIFEQNFIDNKERELEKVKNFLLL